MPAIITIDEVDDLDMFGFEITSSYILSNFSVADAGGVTSSHNIYTLTNSIPYAANHRHQITRV